MGIDIRSVVEGDLSACHTIESSCFLPAEAASRASIEKRIAVFPEGFLVAESDGQVVGQVNSAATHKDDITDEALKKMIGHRKEGKNMVIFSLAVLPDFQGRGIAEVLMQRYFETCRQLAKEKILLICKSDLVGYYERLGFAYGGKSASTHGGVEWHEMVFPLDR